MKPTHDGKGEMSHIPTLKLIVAETIKPETWAEPEGRVLAFINATLIYSLV